MIRELTGNHYPTTEDQRKKPSEEQFSIMKPSTYCRMKPIAYLQINLFSLTSTSKQLQPPPEKENKPSEGPYCIMQPSTYIQINMVNLGSNSEQQQHSPEAEKLVQLQSHLKAQRKDYVNL